MIDQVVDTSAYPQHWMKGDFFHRLDGPARSTDGNQEWYVHDKNITQEVQSWMKEYYIPLDYTLWSDYHKTLFRLRF